MTDATPTHATSRGNGPSPEPAAAAAPGTFGEKFDRLRVEAEADRPAHSVDRMPPMSASPAASAGASGAFVAGLLYVLACLAGGLGVLGGLYRLSIAAEGEITVADGFIVAGWMVAGLALAACLVAVAMLLNGLERFGRRQREAEISLADLGDQVQRLGRLAVDPAVLDRLEDRLREVNESVAEASRNALLDEAARGEKRRQVEYRERTELVEQIRRDMSAGLWDRAAQALERFRRGYPGDSEAERLAGELSERRSTAELEDVAAARRQCDELMSVGAWDRAESAASELVDRHPDSTTAKGVLSRVQRERKMAEEQQRQELYSKIQRHTSRRQWSEALAAAGRLVDTFPNSIEAEAVKAQMDTLADNAEIQHRQTVELEIKDLVKRQRFDQAVDLAEDVIRDYPHSPQAAVLKDQLPRLREKAEQAERESRKRRAKWE